MSLHSITNSFDVENTPLINLLNDLLVEYNTTLRTLLGSFDTEANRNTGPDASAHRFDVCNRIIALDKNLQILYDEIARHQARQDEIRSIQTKVIQGGKAKTHFIESVLDAKENLEMVISDADKQLDKASVAEAANPSVNAIIAYAKKISPYTAAPPNYDPKNTIVPAEPPYPVEVAMRMGVLNQYRTKNNVDRERDAENAADANDDYFFETADDIQFGDLEASDLLLGLDLNPDLE